MSFNSKKTIASVAAGIIGIVAYAIFALGNHAPAEENIKAWAAAMLVFIGICVVAVIIVQIVFHIVAAVGIAINEKECDDKTIERNLSSLMVEDERDKLINLKASHIGSVFVGVGFVSMLVALSFGFSGVVSLHIIFGAFAAGSIAEGIASVYCYENGVRNG